MTTITKMGASAALMLGLAASATAGPTMSFGPEGKGELQLDYKGQFQMMVRDTGSGANGDETTTSFNIRRNRLALMGAYGDVLSLYVQTEYADQTGINLSVSYTHLCAVPAWP